MKVKKSSLQASIAIEQKTEHPNKAPFSGTLFYVDRPSENAPSGTGGKRLLVPRDVAENALPTLIGMGVNTSYWLDDHEVTNKIGVIEEAWIDGDAVKVAGYLFAKDFPDMVNEIREWKEDIGMSMETTETVLEDTEWQGITVAKATSIVFTGAAILYKWAAAYTTTAIAAKGEGKDMKEILEAIASMKTDILNEVKASVEKAKEDITNETKSLISQSVDPLKTSMEEIKAGAAPAVEPASAAPAQEPQRRSLDATQLQASGKFDVQGGIHAAGDKPQTDVIASIDSKNLSTVQSMAEKLSFLSSL